MKVKKQESTAVTVENVTAAYDGKVAIYDTSFSLASGTITALVGPNGGGKSTLFKSIMGFITPIKGIVTITGQTPIIAQKQNKVAYVPQSEENDWNFPITVFETILMGRYAHMNFLRNPRKVDILAVNESLDRVNMSQFAHRQIGELSGGQKKRVFLARALAQGGHIILLDEPFTGVDAKTEMAIISLLKELRSSGATILVSTHDLNTISQYCDQVLLLDKRLIAQGSVKKVFTKQNITKTFGGMLLALQ